MKKLLFLVALILAGASQVRADEGMWLPSEILKKIKDIQSQGFKLSAEDIYTLWYVYLDGNDGRVDALHRSAKTFY